MTVQIGQLESSPHLPTLDALDVEFGCKDDQCAAARIRQGDTPMNSTFSLTQSEFPTRPVAARPTADEMTRSSIDATIRRPSLAKRALRELVRFLVVFGIGIAATLAWQSYGDTARATIANSSPQLGWLAPQTPPVASTAPEVVAPAAAAASPDLQQLVLGLASVRQSADQLAAQLAASQGQMGSEIAKLQADQQKILHKLSAASPRPAAAPAPKPTPVTPPPSPSAQAR
jgi:pyruvate/2-oxoglutarate dehydrogenase complex dihydrolipoamide acyltransferase (E2) component